MKGEKDKDVKSEMLIKKDPSIRADVSVPNSHPLNRKTRTSVNLFIFLRINNPPTNRAGNRCKSAIHQLAPWCIVKATNTAPKAAGLNICLPFQAIKYLDAIADIPATVKVGQILKKLAGPNIRERINPVIREDSILIGTLNSLANNLFENQQIVTK